MLWSSRGTLAEAISRLPQSRDISPDQSRGQHLHDVSVNHTDTEDDDPRTTVTRLGITADVGNGYASIRAATSTAARGQLD